MTTLQQALPIQLPLTVISGGQTGGDLGGLLAAKLCGVATTGWAPRGWRTEKGAQPLLGQRFGLLQHANSNYDARTTDNIRDSDVTLIFSPVKTSPGTLKTIDECIAQDKAYWLISEFKDGLDIELIAFLHLMKPRIINVAGNRESVSPGLTGKTRDALKRVLITYLATLRAIDKKPAETEPQ